MARRFSVVWSSGVDFHKARVSDGRVVVASHVKDNGWFIFLNCKQVRSGIKTRMRAVRVMRSVVFRR